MAAYVPYYGLTDGGEPDRNDWVEPSEKPFHELLSHNELVMFLHAALGIVCFAVKRSQEIPVILQRAPRGGARHQPPTDRFLIRQLFLYLMHPWLGVKTLAEVVNLGKQSVWQAQHDVRIWRQESPALAEMSDTLAEMLEGLQSALMTSDKAIEDARAAVIKQREAAQAEKQKRAEAKPSRTGVVLPGQNEAAAMLIVGKSLREASVATGIEFKLIAELYCRLTASGQMIAIRQEARRRSKITGSKPTPLPAVLQCL